MKYLVTDYKNSMDFMIGLMKLKRENPLFMQQTLQALEGSDVCMYGTCSGFVRDAADKLGIPCIRYFYSPYDRTDLYSLYSVEHNTPAVGKPNTYAEGSKMGGSYSCYGILVSLHFVGKIPNSYIFPRVKAVVHHGGCTTNGIGIWAGCPTLIIPLALDQWYYGRTVHELGIGPEPLYIRKKLCTKEQIKDALNDLVSGKYENFAII